MMLDGERGVEPGDSARHPPEWMGVGQPEAGNRDALFVAAELARIMALAEAEQFDDAREASAALMFGFQPLLLTNPALLSLFATALRRCEARQLLRRLTIAAQGEPA